MTRRKKNHWLKNAITYLIYLLTLSTQIYSQGLEDIIANLAAEAASNYARPIAGTFGSNLNSAWVDKVPSPHLRELSVQFSIIGMGSFWGDEDKSFATYGNYRFTSSDVDKILVNSGIRIDDIKYAKLKSILLASPQVVYLEGPTLIGKSNEFLRVKYLGSEYEGVVIKPFDFMVRQVKGYLGNLSFLPTAALQLRLGTICGTKLMFRFLPSMNIEKLGRFSFWGIGFIHNPEAWTYNFEYFDYGFGFFHQKMDVGDLFTSSATQLGLYISRTFGEKFKLTPLASIRYEMSKTILSYTYSFTDKVYEVPITITRPISLELVGRNKWSVGFNLLAEYYIFNLAVGYKLSTIQTFRIGLAFDL